MAEAAVTGRVPVVGTYGDITVGLTAVQLALGGFISLAARAQGAGPQTPTAPAAASS